MIVWGLGSRLDWTLFPQGKPWRVLSNNNDDGSGDDIDHDNDKNNDKNNDHGDDDDDNGDHDNNYNIYNKAGHLLLF